MFKRKRKRILSVDEISRRVSPIAAKYGVLTVYLFGSYARGEADSDSDVDLCIDRGRIRGYFQLCEFECAVSEALGRDVDVVTTGASEEFISKIRKDMVKIYEG